jgi:hypothetical protein
LGSKADHGKPVRTRQGARRSFLYGAAVSFALMLIPCAALLYLVYSLESGLSMMQSGANANSMALNTADEVIALRQLVRELDAEKSELRDTNARHPEVQRRLDWIARRTEQIRSVSSEFGREANTFSEDMPTLPPDWELSPVASLDAHIADLDRFFDQVISWNSSRRSFGSGIVDGGFTGVGDEQALSLAGGDNRNDLVTAGRIIHHAPKKMLLGRAYFIEVLIQPVGINETADSVDVILRGSIGPGAIMPGDPILTNVVDDIAVSPLMEATLQGSGYAIEGHTPTKQLVASGDPTKWVWSVTPTKAGHEPIILSVSQIQTINGEVIPRTVKTEILVPEIRSLDTLLSSYEQPFGSEGRSRSAPSPLSSENLIPAESVRASDGDRGAASAAIEGCTTSMTGKPNRFALVITNQQYNLSIGKLKNTHADGDRIGDALKKVGYQVTQCKDLDLTSTKQVIARFAGLIQQSSATQSGLSPFLYYSGHGVSSSGSNYIIPVDAKFPFDYGIQSQTIIFDDILDLIWVPDRSTTFAVFDACRTAIDGTKGFTRVDARAVGAGLLLAYASAPGKLAADNGYYSEELAGRIIASPDPADQIFNLVQDAVATRSGNLQFPWIEDGISSSFYFVEN